MFQLNKLILAAAFVTAASFSSAPAMADTSIKDAAKDKRGNFITSTNGNCVRTRWQDNAGDPCAPAPAPAPVVEEKKEEVVSVAKTLQKEQRTVYFDFNKSELTAEAKVKLDSLTEVMKNDKQVKSAKIVGYADRIGSDSYNEKLSQKRSKAVNEYIVTHGFVNTSLAETRWLGESAPITKCPEKATRKEQISCLAEDRRVEVEIDYYDSK